MSEPDRRGDAPQRPDAERGREPATVVLPDLTDLFDRRIDPRRRGDYDRRTFPHWAVPGGDVPSDPPVDRSKLDDVASPTFRFDRGRRGFAAMVAKPLGYALVMTSPLWFTALLLVAARVALAWIGADALPAAMLAVWGIQVLGVLVARGLAYPDWAAVWVTTAVIIGVLVPLLALQALLGGIPFVSLEESSAGPFLAASIGVLAALVVCATGVAVLTRRQPERSSILLLPVAVVIPALLGVPGEALALSVLDSLVIALALAGAWAAVMWLAPRGIWLLATPIALLVQLIVLIVRGGGPIPGPDAGMVVAFGYGSVLVVLIGVSVVMPFYARWVGMISGDRTR